MMIQRLLKPSVLIIASVILTFPHFYNNKDSGKVILNNIEDFDPSLNHCNSIASSVKYVEEICGTKNGKPFDTVNYVSDASKFIHKRFYHGTANYTFSENWIANLLGKYVWSHFYAIVIPNDILKRSKGLCSQQTMVFMELLKSKGITSRKIGIRSKKDEGHFLCEVRYNNSWHLYDVNIEPYWERIPNPHESMDYYLKHKEDLYTIYDGKISKDALEELLYEVETGEPNQFPAKKMRLFHIVTKCATYILPLLFFMFGTYLIYKRRVRSC